MTTKTLASRLLPDHGVARTLASATFVNTLGNGLWGTVSALYLHKIIGMSFGQIGVALTAAALVNLVASAPLGYLADRLGPRGMQAGFLLAQAACAASLLVVRSFPAYLVVAVLTAVADAGSRGGRGAMIAGAIPADQRVRTRAYLRATTNLGMSLGAVGAGVGLAVDTRAGYLTLIAADGLTYLIAAALCARLPHVPPVPHEPGAPRLVALRDRPFLACTLLDGIISIHFDVLEIALPLWIVTQTAAPAWMVAVALLINTTMVVLLQVRASRGTEELAAAARASRIGSLLIGAACLFYAGSAGVSTGTAIALLAVGSFVHVLGELRQSAAGWGISFGLAPAHAQGQYQGAYSMGFQLGHLAAPLLLTTVVLGLGRLGWVLLGLLFAVTGAAVPPVVAWARRRMVERAETGPGEPSAPEINAKEPSAPESRSVLAG
ncbi:MFS transporter [Luedemannella flava]|uniref:MFS transporter n=1 Tax=Luedemannella flava TaxID=349316 RepID=A0ABN2MJ46_9ACTN